jgi:hypothetical protein
LHKQAVFTGWGGSSYSIQLAAVPEVYEGDDAVTEAAPDWFQMEDITRDGVVPQEVWDAVLDAVDEKCKAEDAERRRAAASLKSRPKRGGSPKDRPH